MTEARSCASCEAFSALSNECRAKSPQPVLLPNPATGQMATLGIFPATRPENWCLEWRQRES